MAKEIVRKYKNSCNAKTFAEKVYRDLKKINYTDEDLIEVYKEMYTCSLSSYELECLTKKRMCMDGDGVYKLVDVDHTADIFSNVVSVLRGKNK